MKIDPYPEHTRLAKIMADNPLQLFLANLDSGEFTDEHGRRYALVALKNLTDDDPWPYPYPVSIERAQYDLLGIDYDAYMAEFDAMLEEMRKANQ